MSFYIPSGERILRGKTNNELLHMILCDLAVKELRKEGYDVSERLRKLFTPDCDIQAVADTIRAILDDKTGFTASMYGVSLEDD